MTQHSPLVPEKIAACLFAAVEGTITPDEAALLERWIASDPQCLEAYVAYVDLCGDLSLEMPDGIWGLPRENMQAGEAESPEKNELFRRVIGKIIADVEEFPAAAAETAPRRAAAAARKEPPSRAQQSPAGFLQGIKRHFVISLACALLITGIGLAVMAAWRVPWLSHNLAIDDGEEADDAQLNAVAWLVGAQDAVWAAENEIDPAHSGLRAGNALKLEQGWAKIQFADGAVVVLEGPSHFRIEANGAGNLSQGKLSAHVPYRARGFTVHTPLVDVIDLGTQFGVLVDGAQNTEVHVFSGSVATTLIGDPMQPPAKSELRDGEATRFEAETRRQAPVQLNRAGFKFDLTDRNVAQNDSELADGQLILYDGFQNGGANALGATAGGFGWAFPWNATNLDVTLQSKSLQYRDSQGNRLLIRGGSAAQPERSFGCMRVIDCSAEGRAAAAGLLDPETEKLGRAGTTLWISFLGRGYANDKEGNSYAQLGLFEDDARGQRQIFAIFKPEANWHIGGGGALCESTGRARFIVARFDFDEERVRCRAWSDCDLDKDPSDAVAPGVEFSRKTFQFDRMMLSGNRRFDFDELRMGATFASVAPTFARDDGEPSPEWKE